MPRAGANGIELEYDTFGRAADPTLLLVMGFGAPMILWRVEFCERLAARGLQVVRFDNRDCGLSSQIDQPVTAELSAVGRAGLAGEPLAAPYTLSDMAADAVGLLDALGVDAAHVAGASMGGMIVQTLAIEHPKRVRTLVSIMSTTGASDMPSPKPEAMAALLAPVATERPAAIERGLAMSRALGSPGYPFDEADERDLLGRMFDRGVHPDGNARQLLAVMAAKSRRDALGTVRVPTLVIHGIEDPIIPIQAGRDTAAAVPGAELLEIEGMGHDLPRALWPQLVDAIAKHVARG
ncbi:MAG TPA: alpha/beta fold hydrolase [Myxococcota bacterium]|nr:alpha/beta fold hydrolase [Myxococcota bacterium]